MDKIKGYLKLVWAKLLFQLIILALLFVIYFVGKYLLPEKYKFKFRRFKDFIKVISSAFAALPNENDTIVQLFTKSKTVFESMTKLDRVTVSQLYDMAEIIEENDFAPEKDHWFMNQFFKKIYIHSKKEELLKSFTSDDGIYRYTFELGPEEFIKIICIKRHYHNGDVVFSECFGVEKNTNYKKLINIFFNVFGDMIYLRFKESSIEIEPLSIGDSMVNYMPDTRLMSDLFQEINDFKARGYQRSYILNGPPGTGKTSFCLEMSKKYSGKIVKLDSNIFTDAGVVLIKSLIECMEIEFLVIDDIDRINIQDMPKFLLLLDSMKTFNSKTTLFATVNKIQSLPSAVIRPGRFDDILEFDYPNLNERKAFIKNYLKKIGTSMEKEELQYFAEITDGMTQSYIAEYCLKHLVENDPQKLFSKIEKRKIYIKRTLTDTDNTYLNSLDINEMSKEVQSYDVTSGKDHPDAPEVDSDNSDFVVTD